MSCVPYSRNLWYINVFLGVKNDVLVGGNSRFRSKFKILVALLRDSFFFAECLEWWSTAGTAEQSETRDSGVSCRRGRSSLWRPPWPPWADSRHVPPFLCIASETCLRKTGLPPTLPRPRVTPNLLLLFLNFIHEYSVILQHGCLLREWKTLIVFQILVHDLFFVFKKNVAQFTILQECWNVYETMVDQRTDLTSWISARQVKALWMKTRKFLLFFVKFCVLALLKLLMSNRRQGALENSKFLKSWQWFLDVKFLASILDPSHDNYSVLSSDYCSQESSLECQ